MIHKAKTIGSVVFMCTILHFIITSIVGHYIASHVGSLAGQVVAEGIVEASINPHSSIKDVDQTYQIMKVKINEDRSRWEILSLIISLPISPIINSLEKMIIEAWIAAPVRAQQISLEQVKFRASIIDHIANGLNSLFVGILIYMTYNIVKMRKAQK